LELKGTRHPVLSWVPIIIVATVLGGVAGSAANAVIKLTGLELPYVDIFVGSLGGALGLIVVLRKHHIPVRGLPE
jgi:hypothetical protein